MQVIHFAYFKLFSETGGIEKKDYEHIQDTYLDHFLLCSRNPTNTKTQTALGQSCMSKGGIPVQPYFVLGGYNGTKYNGEYWVL